MRSCTEPAIIFLLFYMFSWQWGSKEEDLSLKWNIYSQTLTFNADKWIKITQNSVFFLRKKHRKIKKCIGRQKSSRKNVVTFCQFYFILRFWVICVIFCSAWGQMMFGYKTLRGFKVQDVFCHHKHGWKSLVIKIILLSDSQSVCRGPLMVHIGTAGGSLEINYRKNIKSFHCQIFLNQNVMTTDKTGWSNPVILH